MISSRQKRILAGVAALAMASISINAFSESSKEAARENVASVFLGEDTAKTYVQLDFGNCDYQLTRKFRRIVTLDKREPVATDRCQAIAKTRERAIAEALGATPTPAQCYDFVKDKLPRALSRKKGESACRYFLKYDYSG